MLERVDTLRAEARLCHEQLRQQFAATVQLNLLRRIKELTEEANRLERCGRRQWRSARCA